VDIKELSKKRQLFIKQKLTERNTYQLRYVAFLDLLGFKTITNELRCDEIKALFNDIELIKYSFDESMGKILFSADTVDGVEFTIMSDSVVISVIDSEEGLAYLLFICAKIQSSLLTYPGKMILLRGGISHGEYFKLGNLSFGPAATAAYLLESAQACLPRIILDQSIAKDLNEKNIIGQKGINKYLSYESTGNVTKIINLFLAEPVDDDFYFVDFFNPIEVLRLSQRNELIFHVQNSIRTGLKETDNKIQDKYRWLLNYYNYRMKQNVFPDMKKFLIEEGGE
jgi:hypothetical protein